MAVTTRFSFFLLSLLILTTLVQAEHPTARRCSRARAFIEFQCQTTLYPDLCIRYLSYYVRNLTTLSHQKLAHFAILVSLAKAESTRAYITEVADELERTNAKDYQDVKECLDQIDDGVVQLTNCIEETRKIKENEGSGNFPWHASNVKTWMSTAMTDASTCLNRFSGRALGRKKKAMIKARVQNLEKVTSNALALFDRFAARYRHSHVKKPKA